MCRRQATVASILAVLGPPAVGGSVLGSPAVMGSPVVGGILAVLDSRRPFLRRPLVLLLQWWEGGARLFNSRFYWVEQKVVIA